MLLLLLLFSWEPIWVRFVLDLNADVAMTGAAPPTPKNIKKKCRELLCSVMAVFSLAFGGDSDELGSTHAGITKLVGEGPNLEIWEAELQ